MEDKLSLFLDQKYVNLETYKKDGTSVRTPVWFMIDNGIIYVMTREKTGKVKRLKNNQNIRIVPCSYTGEPKSEWISLNLCSPPSLHSWALRIITHQLPERFQEKSSEVHLQNPF